MKIIYYLLFIVPIIALGQSSLQNDQKIAIGTVKTFHSNVLNEDRELLVYVPNSGGVDSNTRYPVMYLLDGYSFFHSATGMMQYLSAIGKMPEMIVVAIVNTDRVRDLTPTHSTIGFDGQEVPFLKNSGGGEQFLSFIEKELFPYIDSTYKTEPYRMFVGHSLGGLTVVNTFLNHPALFNAYVAIDPSLWWDNQLLIKQAATIVAQKDYIGKSLFFAAANAKEKGSVAEVKESANDNLPGVDKLQFHELLKNAKNTTLAWDWKFYSEDNHSSVPLMAQYDAMRSLFKKFELDKELSDTTITTAYIKNHYQNLSAALQYPLLPAQSTVNLLGYAFLAHKNYDKAYSFFKMNMENYPTSSNVYDSMGDFYVAQEDRKKAMEYFEKALSLKEVTETRKKLERLKLEN